MRDVFLNKNQKIYSIKRQFKKRTLFINIIAVPSMFKQSYTA